MEWEQISFGKHAGRTAPQVALMDPGYFFGLVGEPKQVWQSARFGAEVRRVERLARAVPPPEAFGACGTHVGRA